MGNKKRLTIALGVCGVLFIGGMVYLYTLVGRAGDMWPHDNAPGSLTSEINSLNREISRLKTEAAKIPAAQENLEAIRVEYELAIRVLPTENSPDQLIAAIRTKAQQAGVIPDRLVPSTRSTAQRRGRGATAAFEEWRFTLNIRGTYDQIASFVNRMEEFESDDAAKTGSEKRFFQVSDISIIAAQSGMALFAPGAALDDPSKAHDCTLIMQTFRFTGGDAPSAPAGGRR